MIVGLLLQLWLISLNMTLRFHTLPGGDAGEKVWRLLRKSPGGPDHPDGVQAVSHEQEL